MAYPIDDRSDCGWPKRFYVKRAKDAETEGPFSIAEINQMIRRKRFAVDSLAVADTGQGLEQVRSTPIEMWIKLTDIPGLEGDPAREKNYVLLIVIIIAIIVLVPLAAMI